MNDEHNVFVQYRSGETITTHAFFTPQGYLESTDDEDNKCKIHKVRYYGKNMEFETVGDFRWWLECKVSEPKQLSLF